MTLPPGGSQGVLTFSVYALPQSVCEPVPGQYRTGRVREPMYWYKPCALLSGGTAARADSIRPYRACPFYGAHCRPQLAVGKYSNHEILAF